MLWPYIFSPFIGGYVHLFRSQKVKFLTLYNHNLIHYFSTKVNVFLQQIVTHIFILQSWLMCISVCVGLFSYSSRTSSLLNRKYASDEARLDAILNAETIMKELPLSNPSFVKAMLQSHVTGGFWLVWEKGLLDCLFIPLMKCAFVMAFI